MAFREIEIIASSLENGRIYFPSTDIKFFPADSLADRDGDGHKGKPVIFRAAGMEFEGDIRIYSGQRISPRPDFTKFFRAVGAKQGAKLRVTQAGPREYDVEYVASK